MEIRISLDKYAVIMAVSTALGLALIAWGASISGPQTTLLVAIGGGIFGSSISIFVGRLIGSESSEDIRNIIKESLGDRLSSEEEEIAPYRRVWHHYHVTGMNGKYIWRYRLFDFSRTRVPGQLFASISAEDNFGTDHLYRIEAAVRGTRFLLVEEAAGGGEPPIVEVFPRMGVASLHRFFGLRIVQTWDGEEIIGCCIFSREPIFSGLAEGDIPEGHWGPLREICEKQASVVLPDGQ